MAKTTKEIAALLQNTKFKRNLVGGIDPSDLWKKLEHLNREYEEVIREERLKSRTLLEEKERQIYQLQKQLAVARGSRPAGDAHE